MLKSIIHVFILFTFLLGVDLSSQTTVEVLIMKDAMIRQYPGDNNNYGNYPYINMHAWTNGSTQVLHRSLLDFNMSQIPPNATILSADLYLFNDQLTGLYSSGHQQLSGSNECIARRVTSPWEEYGVTWNTQPSTTTNNSTVIPSSTSNIQDYVIDLSEIIQDYVDDPMNSHGIMMQVTNEDPYRRLVFASRDLHDPDVEPKLIVTYEISTDLEELTRDELQVKLFPNPTSGVFRIQFNKSLEDLDIHIHSIAGKKILTRSYAITSTIDLNPDLPKGQYIVSIFQGTELITKQKVLIN